MQVIQCGLSASIGGLERQLGTPPLIRKAPGWKLTAAGRVLLSATAKSV